MLKPLEILPLTAEQMEALEKLYRTTKQPVEKVSRKAHQQEGVMLPLAQGGS